MYKSNPILGLSRAKKRECQEGVNKGFVNFKTRRFDDTDNDVPQLKRATTINIPEHLRSQMPDPLADEGTKKGSASGGADASSKSLASKADRLKEELERLQKEQKERVATIAKMRASNTNTSSLKKLAPPPSLSFRKRR